jgi:dihydroorotate dehydrogenase (NAD+) catalytic subunit
VRMISEVHRAVARDAKIPIIGLGGVMTWEDAAEFILAGAAAIGMGTAMFVDPRLLPKVAHGLEQWVRKQGGASLNELVGQARMP